MCCEARGFPHPRVEWSRAEWSPNARLPNQENGYLVVGMEEEISDGSYICRATNDYGVAQASTTVTVSGYVS